MTNAHRQKILKTVVFLKSEATGASETRMLHNIPTVL